MLHRLQALILLILAPLAIAAPDGSAIYTEHCASCHGDQGQGVANEYDESLIGKKSIKSLAKLIHKTMPEEDEDLVINEDALAVAAYIHAAFYSPEAQAKINPVRQTLLRLTKHQYRRSVTDLVQSFIGRPSMGEKNGLSGHYFNKEKMNNRKGKLAQRIDAVIDFDIEKNHGIEKINPQAHAMFWTGSLLPPETGTYRFRATTPNGVKIFINSNQHTSAPLIDAWVSSNNTMKQSEASIFLLGHHAVPILIDFVSFQEKKSSLRFEWKPPHGTWELVPSRVLFPDDSKPAIIVTTPFPPDDASLGYERGSSISKAWEEAVVNAAVEATGLIFHSIDRLAHTKFNKPDRREKIHHFCTQFTTRAFARPLTSEQRATYIDKLFEKAGDDYETAAKQSLMLTLTSPYFLYPSLNRDEKGNPDDHTRAAHLARAIWDSVPDRHLRNLVKKGQFKTPEQILKETWRLIDDPRARDKMHHFFYHWLSLSEKEDLTKDPKTFPGFDEHMIADLRQSLNLFIDHAVWTEPSDYRKLFTSETLFLNERLAKYYGSPIQKDKPFFQTTIPNTQRAGLFTHPYILTAFSYHRQTSPIHRGVYLSRNVLGRFLKPPPNAIEFKDADFAPHLTMREKVTHLTKDESCMACHAIINPIGFSLEYYDAVGRFRTHDGETPINATSDYETPDAEKIRITGPRDLARLAVESPVAHRAFIKHLFHHLIQQPVNSYGFGKMDELHGTFKNSGFHIQKLIATIVSSTAPQ